MTIRFKRGDTFRIECTEYVDIAFTTTRDLTGCTVTCSWKHVATGVYFDATVTMVSASAGIYTVTATPAQTAALALELWLADIRIEEDGVVGSSDTFPIYIEEAITNAA